MLLSELTLPTVPVYHQTTLKVATKILHSRFLKFSTEGSGNDAAGPQTNNQFLSTARSKTSAYIEQGGGGNVILVLNKARLQANNKVVPYQDPDAVSEIGDEMEDRVYGRNNGIHIQSPVNNTIIQIIVEGGRSYDVPGSAAYTEQDFEILERWCAGYHIPIIFK